MNFPSRVAVGHATNEESVSADWARKSAPEAQKRPPAPVGELVVEGEVFEVLPGFGLAHLRTHDGSVYGVSQDTPGIENFGALHEGQRFRCEVTRKFNRVLRAQLIA